MTPLCFDLDSPDRRVESSLVCRVSLLPFPSHSKGMEEERPWEVDLVGNTILWTSQTWLLLWTSQTVSFFKLDYVLCLMWLIYQWTGQLKWIIMKPRLFAHGEAQTCACPQRLSTMLCEDLRYEIFEISYWGEIIQGCLNCRWMSKKKRLKYQVHQVASTTQVHQWKRSLWSAV